MQVLGDEEETKDVAPKDKKGPKKDAPKSDKPVVASKVESTEVSASTEEEKKSVVADDVKK